MNYVNYSYSEKSTEESHITSVSTLEGSLFRTLVWDICDNSTSKTRAMARSHLSPRNVIFRIRHSCNFCDNKFMAIGILRNQKLSHTGEKPFSGHKLASPVIKRSCKEEDQLSTSSFTLERSLVYESNLQHLWHQVISQKSFKKPCAWSHWQEAPLLKRL